MSTVCSPIVYMHKEYARSLHIMHKNPPVRGTVRKQSVHIFAMKNLKYNYIAIRLCKESTLLQ